MRKTLWILLALCLLPAAAARALTPDEARHLLERTGFGAAPSEIRALLPLERAEAVDRLLDGVRTEAQTPPPHWVENREDLRALRNMHREARDLEAEQRRMLFQYVQRRNRLRGQELKAWWVGEMLATPSPLTERLTLFWSNHFTSSLQKVKDPRLLHAQNRLLRRHALGDFGEMLHAIARDPAMLLYLDNQTNNKGKPNENFARELLELFTLGEGHYSEQDIKEAARAFTGWKANRFRGTFVFARSQHDDGIKTFLGRSGPLDGGDIIEALLGHERTAEHIVEKLWREFISPQPGPREAARLASIFRETDYALRPLLREMLLSQHFWSVENRGSLVKSPVELLVGHFRSFGLTKQPGAPLAAFARFLGQDLLDPPNVRGWVGGTAWIDANSLLMRRTFLERMIEGDPRRARRSEPMMDERVQEQMQEIDSMTGLPEDMREAMRRQTMALQKMMRPELDPTLQLDLTEQARRFGGPDTAWLLALPPVAPPPPRAAPGQALAALLLDPVYQLK